jgi:nitrite reductase/ring-hydroxylating ferredoxin subunit
MIPNQWYAILEADKVGREDPVPVVRMGERMVLWRDGSGHVVCLDDRCAHRGIALSMGRVHGGRLHCAYHGMQYDAAGCVQHIPCAGEGAKIPATLRARSYVVREEHGLVWLWWGEERDTYPAVPWIDEVPTEPRRGKTHSEIWPFNYVRCVENHLDVHHWAFVHRNIMLGVGEFFDEFELKLDDDGLGLKTWGTLKRTDKHGKRERKGWAFRCHLRLPSVNMIQVTPRFKSILFHTPVDEESTWVCVRSVQSYATWQPAKWMIDNYCVKFLFSVPLHRQDFPLFHEQRPRQSGVGVNKLVAADAGIAKYLAMRDKLMKAARKEAEERRLATPPQRNDERAPWELRDDNAATSHPALPVLASAPSLLPARARNAHLGREGRWGRFSAWVLACMAFPLLVPSLISTRLLDWWDEVR